MKPVVATSLVCMALGIEALSLVSLLAIVLCAIWKIGGAISNQKEGV